MAIKINGLKKMFETFWGKGFESKNTKIIVQKDNEL